MRLLHLAWPHLLVRLACSRDPGLPADGPIIVGGRPWDDAVVLDASRAARDLGVRRGISLGHAARLVPEARFLPPRPAEDAAAVDAALDALAAFSPSVAGTVDPADPAFGVLEAQVDGLEPLWGPEPVLAGRVVATLTPLLPGRPLVAIAGTRFAAALAARVGGGGHPGVPEGRSAPLEAPPGGLVMAPPGGSLVVRPDNPVVVPHGADAAFLAPFPAWTLTHDPDVRGRLARLGITRVGQVAAIPRSALVARFGAEGGRFHARASGIEDDPFRSRRPPERLALAIPIEPPVEDLEAIRFVLRRLGRALAGQLDARGEAAGRARLVLGLDRTFVPGGDATGADRAGAGQAGPDQASWRSRDPVVGAGVSMATTVIEQRFPEPTADAEAIERLLLERLARQPVPAPVERIELELAEVGPAAGQQLALFVPQANRSARLGWQLVRLAVRHGPDRVGRVALDDPDALLPEARSSWRAVEVDSP